MLCPTATQSAGNGGTASPAVGTTVKDGINVKIDSKAGVAKSIVANFAASNGVDTEKAERLKTIPTAKSAGGGTVNVNIGGEAKVVESLVTDTYLF